MKSLLFILVAGGRPESGLTSRLDEQVRKARSHIEWRKEYMTLLERDERMREEGREEERKNTLRESARADAAEKEMARMQVETERLRAELEALRRARTS